MIELRGQHATLRLSPTVWTMTLELARLAGWQPAGTRLASGEQFNLDRAMLSWQVQYTASDGQTISGEDAEKLAAALSRVLTDGQQMTAKWDSGQVAVDAPLRTPPGGFKWFTSDAGREHLRTLHQFCAAGAFQVL